MNKVKKGNSPHFFLKLREEKCREGGKQSVTDGLINFSKKGNKNKKLYAN